MAVTHAMFEMVSLRNPQKRLLHAWTVLMLLSLSPLELVTEAFGIILARLQ
jgi:hypothetical protein